METRGRGKAKIKTIGLNLELENLLFSRRQKQCHGRKEIPTYDPQGVPTCQADRHNATPLPRPSANNRLEHRDTEINTQRRQHLRRQRARSASWALAGPRDLARSQEQNPFFFSTRMASHHSELFVSLLNPPVGRLEPPLPTGPESAAIDSAASLVHIWHSDRPPSRSSTKDSHSNSTLDRLQQHPAK